MAGPVAGDVTGIFEAKGSMEHFSMQKWIDFVRGVAPAVQSLAMQKHLDGGCAKCGKVVETWKHVLDCAAREKSYETPEACVRMAKAQFALNCVLGERSRRVSFADLVFDSIAQPVAPGIRSTGSAARQLVFRKGSYSVDMRIESHGNRLSITGQVLDAGQANSGVRDISVRLLAHKQQTTTSRFGEFQFDVDSMEDLGLLFVLNEERDLMISIPVSRVRPFQDSGSPVIDETT
jgi:hypothetical protein